MVLSAETNRSDRALGGVVVDLDTPVVEKARQTFPVREPVADGFSQFALAGDLEQPLLKPELEFVAEL